MDLSEASPTLFDPPRHLDEGLEEEESLLGRFHDTDVYGKKGKKTDSPAGRWTKWLVGNLVFTVVNLAVFITLLFLLYSGHVVYKDNAKFLLPPSPAIGVIEKELRPFEMTSPYNKPPGPKVDQLWNDLVNTGAIFTLSAEEFASVNDSPETGIKLPHDPQGRYLGTLASTHQVHCVDALRKGLYFHYKYYQEQGDAIFVDKDPPEEHLMHCVEMLRQAVMCSGDVSVVTYNWKKGHPGPKASFGSMHACQKWEKIEEWRHIHNVTGMIQTLERPVRLLDDDPEDLYGNQS